MVTHQSPIRSSTEQEKFASQRPTYYHCATQPTEPLYVHGLKVRVIDQGQRLVLGLRLGFCIDRRQLIRARPHQQLVESNISNGFSVTSKTFERCLISHGSKFFPVCTQPIQFNFCRMCMCNSLPDFIRDPSISTDSFRRLLKTYLFARY